MELTKLIDALSDPTAYPYAVPTVEVRQTHISVVFLVGPYVYKIKKPVNLGFLDYTTLEKRRHFCEEEIRLNRRLAPRVYLDVVPVARCEASIKLEGLGEVIEWAVKMERLPDEATLESHVERGTTTEELAMRLARTVATFHARADSGPHISRCARFDVVAANARENFTQSAAQAGAVLGRGVFARLQALTEDALSQQRALIERRAARDVPRDTHGDLRLDHVYLFPDRNSPADLVIIDCIEFNEQYRFADPVADMAFLAMEFKYRARRDLARAFAEAYFREADDEEGRALLPFYTSYRAAVRGKVEGMKATETEVPWRERDRALLSARGHWLLALGELELSGRRPCLVLIGGLPGTGKSTLAAELAEAAGCCLIRTDVVRKELTGAAGQVSGPLEFGKGIYTPEWTERTYAECLTRAEALLCEGHRVIVDASFQDDVKRRLYIEAAARLCVPALFLLCQSESAVIRQRLAMRHGDASDADWSIHNEALKTWQPLGTLAKSVTHTIATSEFTLRPLDQALRALREWKLFN